jgi:hypothetical protein
MVQCACYEEVAAALSNVRALADIVVAYAHGGNIQKPTSEIDPGIYMGFYKTGWGIESTVTHKLRLSDLPYYPIRISVTAHWHAVASRCRTEVIVNGARDDIGAIYKASFFVANMLDHGNALKDALDSGKIAKALEIPRAWMDSFTHGVDVVRGYALTRDGRWNGAVYGSSNGKK